MLFINNFYPQEYTEQCLPWTWYLANDFQFFIIGKCYGQLSGLLSGLSGLLSGLLGLYEGYSRVIRVIGVMNDV